MKIDEPNLTLFTGDVENVEANLTTFRDDMEIIEPNLTLLQIT